MLSLFGADFDARSFLTRAIVASIILAITLAVSVIWEKMVYTIPVLAVLLFLAAGLRGLSERATRRNLDEDAVEVEMDVEAGSGMEGGS